MRSPRSLRARITVAAVAAVALSGLIAGILLLAAVQHDGRQAVDQDLQARADGVMRQAGGPGRRGPPNAGDDDGDTSGRALLAGSGTFVRLDYRGQVVEQRGDVPAEAPAFPSRDGLATVRIGDENWRALTVTLDGDGDLRYQVLSSLHPVDERVESIRKLIVVIGLIALSLTALAAWWFTSVAVRPLARLRESAARVSGAEDLSTPLPDDTGPEEVRSLARALNEMLSRLQASTDALERALHATRRFAADAGHELRTPLTGMRATLDTLARNPGLTAAQRGDLVAEITAEQERIVHLLEGLQALARGEAADTLPREEVEFADLVDAAMYEARRRHPTVSYDLDEDIGDATVHGWPSGVRLLVDNLLDNAALHGRAAGRVEVSLTHGADGVVLRIDDDGPGIPAAERDRVLEPFTRGEGTSVSGTGLGLAIVAQQIALHNGTLELGDASLGGLSVRVTLPASARPAPAVPAA